MFSILREVEKEVVLLDPAASNTGASAAQGQGQSSSSSSSQGQTTQALQNPEAMQVEMTPSAHYPNAAGAGSMGMSVDGAAQSLAPGTQYAPGSRVLKVIKKLEVLVLCAQHNPVCLPTPTRI